jgi:hypothetical protein
MEIEEVSNSAEIGLFREKFYTDWVVILGLAGAAMGAFSAARGYGNARDFVASDWVALAIDASIGAGINMLIFGFLPAIFRRRSLRASGAKSKPGEYMPTWKFPLLVLALCPIVVIAAANTNEAGMSLGTSMSRCVPNGADEVCIDAKDLGGNEFEIRTTWKYSTERSISGLSVSEVSWMSKIDCNLKTGYVDYLFVYNSDGGRVDIPDFERNQMMRGINTEQMGPIVAQACPD